MGEDEKTCIWSLRYIFNFFLVSLPLRGVLAKNASVFTKTIRCSFAVKATAELKSHL